MQDAKQLEAQMKFKMFGKKAKRTESLPGLQVILSVCKTRGGQVQRYSTRISTISKLDAKIRAEQQARKEGLHPHALLYVGTKVYDANTPIYDMHD